MKRMQDGGAFPRETQIFEADSPAGILKWNLLWGEIPFLELLYIEEGFRGRGIGSRSLMEWETDLRKAGFEAALVSTRADETGQHFFRKSGYLDCGVLHLREINGQEAEELFLYKKLKENFIGRKV